MWRALILVVTIFYLGEYPVLAQFYQTTSANIKFFSSAPVEDIEAISNEGIAVLNAKNGAISFKVKMRSFNFEKALMQEHFNENYVESEKFPEATFKGESTTEIDMNSSSPQNLVFNGVFAVHGISQERSIPVVLTISENGKKMELRSTFEVACEDHKIKIPRLLWENIAEVIEVSVNANFEIIK